MKAINIFTIQLPQIIISECGLHLPIVTGYHTIKLCHKEQPDLVKHVIVFLHYGKNGT